jgi:hypothetical protein
LEDSRVDQSTEVTPPTPRGGDLAAPALAYMASDSRLTLRQGLAEYFAQSNELMESSELPPDMGTRLESHDVAHVVFGCDTSFLGEAALVRWSLFGVTGSVWPYLIGFQRKETRGLFLDAFASFRLSMIGRLLTLSARAITRSLRMRERWPFEDYDRYLDQPLGEIRERFGIRVLGKV